MRVLYLQSGETAKRLVEGVSATGGILGFRDLREYKPIWRAPLKLRFGAYDIYTIPPPSGGGLVIGEMLNILANDGSKALQFELHGINTRLQRRKAIHATGIGDAGHGAGHQHWT